MKKLHYIFLGLALVVTVGCATNEEVEDKIKERAAFDLNCSSRDVEITLFDRLNTAQRINSFGFLAGGEYGATGCGKKVTYKSFCSAMNCSVEAIGEIINIADSREEAAELIEEQEAVAEEPVELIDGEGEFEIEEASDEDVQEEAPTTKKEINTNNE